MANIMLLPIGVYLILYLLHTAGKEAIKVGVGNFNQFASKTYTKIWMRTRGEYNGMLRLRKVKKESQYLL